MHRTITPAPLTVKQRTKGIGIISRCFRKRKFRRKTHGNMVLRGSVHRRRLCKFKEMRY